MSPRRSSFVPACLAALLALCSVACDDEPAGPLAWLVAYEGPVRIDRAQAAEGGSQDAPLYAGDWVSTGPAAKATLRYANRAQISLTERSRVRIGGSPARFTLELGEGSLLSDTRQGSGGGVTVLTEKGELQVLHGSEIQFTLAPGGESTMEVRFGRAQLIAPDGGALTVLEGETLDLVLGTARRAAPDAGTDEAGPVAEQRLPIQLQLSAPRGRAQLRAAGEGRFSPAPETLTAIPAGTELKVAKDGSALLRGRGLEGRFGAGSEARLGEALLQGDRELYALGLERGGAELEFNHRGARTLILKSRGREVTLASRDLGTVSATVAGKGLELWARAGALTVTAGSAERILKTGERVTLTGNVLGQTQRPQAALTLPHSKRLRVYADRLELVALSLPKVPGAVKVEVARDPAFADRVLAGLLPAEDAVVVPAPSAGELFWRVLSADDDELGKGHARFTKDGGRSAIDLENPKADVAETGLKATVLFQTVLPSITFSFSKREGAASYRVRVFATDNLQKPVAEQVVTDPRATFEAGALREGEYLWNAAPLGPGGDELSGGRMNRLELTYDNSRTSLAIARPRLNEVASASGRGIPVEGIAPVGSKLWVNGRPAPVDSKGRFVTEVPRAELLVFRLISETGAEGYWLRPIRRR